MCFYFAGGVWMECNNQKNNLCSFSVQNLDFPLTEARIMMWESQEMKSSHQAICATGIPGDGQVIPKICSDSSKIQDDVSVHRKLDYVTCTPKEQTHNILPSPSIRSYHDAVEHDVTQLVNGVSKKETDSIVNSSNHFVPGLGISKLITSDDPENSETRLPVKSSQTNWYKSNRGKGQPVNNVSTTKLQSAHLQRIQQMRTKFLKDKDQFQNRRQTMDCGIYSAVTPVISHGNVPSATDCHSSSYQCHSMSRHVTEPVQQSSQVDSAKTMQGQYSMKKSENESLKLQNSVLDKVLKYLPKGARSKLSFIDIEQRSNPEKTKLRNRSGVSFQGYIPKCSVIKKQHCPSGEERMPLSQKDGANPKAKNTLQKQPDKPKLLSESCDYRSSKLRLSISPCRGNVEYMTKLSPLKKRMKRTAEISDQTITRRELTVSNKRKGDCLSPVIIKRHASFPVIKPIRYNNEEVVCSNNEANTEDWMSQPENIRSNCDKAELTKSFKESDYDVSNSQYGLSELETAIFQQGSTWIDENSANVFGLEEVGHSADFPVLNHFTTSSVSAEADKSKGDLSVTSWIQPTFSDQSFISRSPCVPATFIPCGEPMISSQSFTTQSLQHLGMEFSGFLSPVKKGNQLSSEQNVLFSQSPSNSPESVAGIPFLLNGRTKVQWS